MGRSLAHLICDDSAELKRCDPAAGEGVIDAGWRPAAIAPYEKHSEKASRHVFDRNSEILAPVPIKWLRTVAEVLRDYHRQPEYKFLGGGWNEEGVLRRRHVFADTIEDIGKESDGWEEDDARTEDQPAVITYPPSSSDRERMISGSGR
jgi:hypothetical protein